MGIIFAILYWLILGLLLILAVLLLTPFSYYIKGGYKEHYFCTGAFGVSKYITLEGTYSPEGNYLKLKLFFFNKVFQLAQSDENEQKEKTQLKGKQKDKQKNKVKEKAEKKSSSPIDYLQTFLDKKFIKEAINLIKDLINIVRPQKLVIESRGGFLEPHYTGWLIGITNIINQSKYNVQVYFEPLWDEEYFEGKFSLMGRFSIAMLLLRSIRFIFTKSSRSVLKKLWLQKRFKKSLQH